MFKDYKRARPPRKKRQYASYFEWFNKPRKELGIVEDLFNAMELLGEKAYDLPRISKQDPPDCVANDLSGHTVALEVVEFVSEEAVRRNEKGEQVVKFWQPSEVLIKIDAILKEKDNKTYNDGPFSQIIVVIHTDEYSLDYSTSKDFIETNIFMGFRQITHAYLLFSFHPYYGYCPYIELRLSPDSA